MLDSISTLREREVCFASTPGGHLQSLRLLSDSYVDSNHIIFTYDSVLSREMNNTWILKHIDYHSLLSIRAVLNFVLISVQMFIFLTISRPNVVISTGGEVAPFFLYLGKLTGADVIFIEDISRSDSRSNSGKLVYPIADEFFVQHEETVELYGDKAEYHGSVL